MSNETTAALIQSVIEDALMDGTNTIANGLVRREDDGILFIESEINLTELAEAVHTYTAWDCLQAAEACRKRALSDRAPEIAAQYRDAMTDLQRQAELFTALATAPETVGLECGIALERRRDADTEKAQMQRDLAERIKAGR